MIQFNHVISCDIYAPLHQKMFQNSLSFEGNWQLTRMQGCKMTQEIGDWYSPTVHSTNHILHSALVGWSSGAPLAATAFAKIFDSAQQGHSRKSPPVHDCNTPSPDTFSSAWIRLSKLRVVSDAAISRLGLARLRTLNLWRTQHHGRFR